MLPKTFDSAAVEPRIYEAWEKADIFRAGAGAKPDAEPFSIVIPPPNVTGSLHLGHALDNTLQDILVRFHRMRGRAVLWQPGTDHAGIATQMVVERQMMERQEPDRRTIGRDAFLEKVWAWKAESGGQIINQLKRLGASADWSRERFTMDEGLSRAVTKVFVELYRAGLIYKDKRLVNWDPKLQTAISDLEVQQVEVKGKLWHFRYPLADGVTYQHPYVLDAEGNKRDWKPSDGEPAGHDTRDYIVVATTRPETLLGDTGVAVNPEDPRYSNLVGGSAILPLVGRKLRIVGDAYADPDTGSGAVKITPAHDFNDFEVGKRQGLAQISIFDNTGAVRLWRNFEFWDGSGFVAGIEQTDEFVSSLWGIDPDTDEVVAFKLDDPKLAELRDLDGLDRLAARKRIVEMMEASGFLDGVEDHVHSVPHGDRSGVPIEPYLTDQWYVDAKTLAGPAMDAVRSGATRFVPKNWETTYFQWMENIQPWCISRQLWWGHQIPVWYGPEGAMFCEISEADAVAAAKTHFGKPVQVLSAKDGGLASILGSTFPDSQGRTEFKGEVVPIWRDEDVLDTWFSSALWPFSTMGWPDKTPELAKYYPTSTLVTGFDIIFFWVARMMMMGLHFMKEVPFHDVYIHALILDEKGQKMSKSKGNVIDPLGLIDQYGADALRFTLASLAGQGRNIRMSAQRVEGYRNFATKIWNAAKFAEHYECRSVPGFNLATLTETLNRWIATETTRAARIITEATEAYRFNDAAAEAYRFVWNLVCDWYLELAKPSLNGPDGAAKDETRATVAWLLDQIAALLHPIMPFLTEELWRNADRPGQGERQVLALSPWPTLAFEDDGAAAEINWVIDLISAIRSVRSEMNVPAGAMVDLAVSGSNALTEERLKTHETVIARLARTNPISLADAPLAGAVQIVLGEATISMPLAGVIDIAAERTRLTREVEKIAKDMAQIEAKLGNEQFVSRAKPEVVEEQRERLAEATERKAKVEVALSRLAG